MALSAHAADEPNYLQRIEASQTLRVCIWPEYYGVSFRNPKTQRLSGTDIDNAYDVAKVLGAKVEFIDSSFATLIQDIIEDRCDIAMFGIGITPARQEKLYFTQPYLVSDTYAITTKTNRRIQNWADIDKPSSVVAVAKGTLHESLMKAKLQFAELRVVDTPAAREQEVQSGRADVFITDYPFSRRMLDSNDWARLVSPTNTFHATPYAWAMHPKQTGLHARINQILADMKRDGRLQVNALHHGLESIISN